MKALPWIAMALVAGVLVAGALLDRSGEDLLAWEVRGSEAVGTGVTDSRSVGSVRALLSDHPEVDTLVLADMPGTMDADMNLRIARRILRAGLATRVPADGRIASGAVDLFLAGVERDAECGAMIGVHSWAVAGHRGGYEPADAGVRDTRAEVQRRWLAEIGMDPDFYEFTRDAARASAIHWLTREEMERWGVTTVDRDCG